MNNASMFAAVGSFAATATAFASTKSNSSNNYQINMNQIKDFFDTNCKDIKDFFLITIRDDNQYSRFELVDLNRKNKYGIIVKSKKHFE